jgi:hypothetical protein
MDLDHGRMCHCQGKRKSPKAKLRRENPHSQSIVQEESAERTPRASSDTILQPQTQERDGSLSLYPKRENLQEQHAQHCRPDDSPEDSVIYPTGDRVISE